MRCALWWPVLALALSGGGCGDRLVDGGYKGQATLQLHGVMSTSVGQPAAAAVGASWLGYSALVQTTPTLETSVLPISSFAFPPEFVCDVLDAPLSTGRYAWPGLTLPAFIRIARLQVVNDVDGDLHFEMAADGGARPPDQLLAVGQRNLLLFVDQLPADPSAMNGAFLNNWELAVPGYNLIELDPETSPPSLTGHVVPSDARVIFGPPASPPGGAP